MVVYVFPFDCLHCNSVYSLFFNNFNMLRLAPYFLIIVKKVRNNQNNYFMESSCKIYFLLLPVMLKEGWGAYKSYHVRTHLLIKLLLHVTMIIALIRSQIYYFFTINITHNTHNTITLAVNSFNMKTICLPSPNIV